MTYISALSFPHRLAGWPDPTKPEMVKFALRGYTKSYPSHDPRLPITLPILERIITACNDLFPVCYQRKLIKAMYALALLEALRATDSKYGESNDSSENSDFLLLRQKDPFGELFSEIYFKSSSELTLF